MKRFLQLSVLVFLTANCQSSFAQKKIAIVFSDFKYEPNLVSDVQVADTVEWTGDFTRHPLTSVEIPLGAMQFGKTDGTTYQYIVAQPGLYTYKCQNHNTSFNMNGSFTVITNKVHSYSANGIKLEQNYPNPASGQTNIGFSLEKATDITLSLYTSAGEFVKSLATGTYGGGKHSILVDASLLSNGVYFYRMSAGSEDLAGQMVVTK